IRLDTCPSMLAAQATIVGGNGTPYIPPDSAGNSFVVNSWCQLNGLLASWAQGGTLVLNDTIEFNSSGSGGAKWIGDIIPHKSGGVSVSSWGSNPRIGIGGAHPAMYWSGAQFAAHMSHITFSSTPVNGSLAVLADGGFNQTFDWIDCAPGSGNSDYMSSCFQF